MMEGLPSLAQLLKQMQQIPYLASRHIYRVAHHFLEMDAHQLQQFCNVLVQAHDNLIKCSRCCVWQEKSGTCLFCDNVKRDHGTICVVETWYDLWAIERTSSYQGVYHVLGGSICPLDGIGPEDLTIDALIARVTKSTIESVESSYIQEIILALNQTPEGEATSAYIARKFEGTTIKITCLARGMPVGSVLEGLDRLTVHKALSERRPF